MFFMMWPASCAFFFFFFFWWAKNVGREPGFFSKAPFRVWEGGHKKRRTEPNRASHQQFLAWIKHSGSICIVQWSYRQLPANMLNLYFEALFTRPPEQCCHSLSFHPLRLIQALFSFGTLSLSLIILFSGSWGKISNLSPNPFSHVCLV